MANAGDAPEGLAFPLQDDDQYAELGFSVDARRLFRDVEEQVALPIHVTGEDAVAAVLCVLGQRLTGGQARDLVESLPRSVGRLLGSCPRHREEKPERFGRAGFLERVAQNLKVANAQAEPITRAVFAVLRRWLPRKEVNDVATELPAELRELWLSPVEAPPIVWPSPLGERAPPPDAITLKVWTEIARSGLLTPGLSNERAFAVVLCTLCRRISRGEARHLLMTLPPGLRPYLERCALHRAEPPETFSRDQFIHVVAEQLGVDLDRAEAISKIVLAATTHVLTPKEVSDVASQLPSELRAWWLGEPAGGEASSPA